MQLTFGDLEGRVAAGAEPDTIHGEEAVQLVAEPAPAPVYDLFEEPFRIDELWGFTEKLERFGIAGFGLPFC